MRLRPWLRWKTVGSAVILNGAALLAVRRRAHQQRRSPHDGPSADWKAAASHPPDVAIGIREEERHRLARDLHDVLGRRIVALRLYLETMQCEDGCADQSGRVEELLTLVDRIDDEIDLLVWQLRPPILDEVGLAAALHAFVRTWSQTNAIPVQFEVERGEGGLAPQIEACLYRIAQEALSNVARHARATHVTVRLERDKREVCLVVRDDGDGFDWGILQQADPEDRRFGIIGMRERARLASGHLDVESAPGRGTAVIARLPVDVQLPLKRAERRRRNRWRKADVATARHHG